MPNVPDSLTGIVLLPRRVRDNSRMINNTLHITDQTDACSCMTGRHAIVGCVRFTLTLERASGENLVFLFLILNLGTYIR